MTLEQATTTLPFLHHRPPQPLCLLAVALFLMSGLGFFTEDVHAQRASDSEQPAIVPVSFESITFDEGQSSNCGPGRTCFDYTFPLGHFPNPWTGTVKIQLEIIQGGSVISSMFSPALSSGTKYCFNINPSNISGLASGLGFDFVATATFTPSKGSGGGLGVVIKKAGSLPDGVLSGRNNDYQVRCPGECDHICCLGACCVDDICIETTAEYCKAKKGVFHGAGTDCKLGHCIVGDLCFPSSQVVCESRQGKWLGSLACPG